MIGTERIPPLIRRNTMLLASTQAFVGAGTQLVPTLGAIMIERLLGSMLLAGLASSLIYVARLLIAYPIGWVMDAHGRKAGLLMGLTLTLVGALGLGTAIGRLSFPLFLVALLVFGLGIGAGQQLRTAAADMYLPERRAEGLGLVLTGSLIGAFGGPILISAAQAGAPSLGADPTALVWFLVPLVVVPSMALVLLIRPDPKAIAADLARFYPGYRPSAERADAMLAEGAGVTAWLRHYPLLVAFLSMFAAQGVMVMLMALTPLVMAHNGHALTMISIAVSLHVVGMYALSLPLGRLADRVGRRNVILVGLAVVGFGAILVPLTAEYAIATLGLVLVGVGWSCINVAVTALIADTVPVSERGRAIGVVDSSGGLASVALPLLGGPLAEMLGPMSLAGLALVLVAVPGALALRLGEPVPGEYAHAVPA
ncbi:MAG: MFS transporter [Chloroflexota bacterium]|nr:MFS transporter [Chloroflexota bacterium]